MAVMSTATIVWWIALGNSAPWFLAGRPVGESGSVLAPQLLLAAVVMVGATLLGGFASRRALRALPAIAAAD